MASKLILTDEVKYLIFSEIYQRFSEPKAKRKAFAILEAAISCFDKKGFENVTLLMIAREAGLTAPGLRHYFSDLKEVRELALKYIRVSGQKIIVGAIGDRKDPDEVFMRYFLAHETWIMNFPQHVRVWLNFLSATAKSKKDRQMNTVAVDAGSRRLAKLLESGRQAGVFHHEDDLASAHIIQGMMLGWFSSLLTEEFKDQKSYSRDMMNACRRVLGVIGAPSPGGVPTRNSVV